MNIMRKNIETLIASGVTAHKVSKETDIPKNTAYRIFKGEASLDNISLRNAEILNDYFLKLKEVGAPIVDKVYQSDNGDIFIKHKNAYQEMSLVNIYELKQLAVELFNSNEVIQCNSKVEKVEGFHFRNYYSLDGEFIGTADIHVLDHFDSCQDFIYLYKYSEKLSFAQFVEQANKIIPKIYKK